MSLPQLFPFLAPLIFCLCLTGCVASLEATVTELAPPIGTPQVARVGEPMLVRGKVTTIPGFRLRNDQYLPPVDDLVLPSARRHDLWICFEKSGDDLLVCRFPRPLHDRIVRNDGSKPQGEYRLVFRPWGEAVGIMAPEGGIFRFDDPSRLAGLFEPAPVPLPGSRKEEIVYDGRFDDMIRFTCKEYEDDLTRPARFFAISVRVGSLGTVTLRESVVEVLSADDREIRFIVRK